MMTEQSNKFPWTKRKIDFKPRKRYLLFILPGIDPIETINVLVNQHPERLRLCDHHEESPGFMGVSIEWGCDQKKTRSQMAELWTKSRSNPDEELGLSWGKSAESHQKCRNVLTNFLLDRIRELNEKLENLTTKEPNQKSFTQMSKKSKQIQKEKTQHKAPKKKKSQKKRKR